MNNILKLNLSPDNIIGLLPRQCGKTTSIHKSMGKGVNLIMSNCRPLSAFRIWKKYYSKESLQGNINDNYIKTNEMEIITGKSLKYFYESNVDYLFIDEFFGYNFLELEKFLLNIHLEKTKKIVLLSTPYRKIEFIDSRYLENIEKLLSTIIRTYTDIECTKYLSFSLPKELFEMELN